MRDTEKGRSRERTQVLVDALVDLPGNGEVVDAERRRSDDTVASLLGGEVLLGLGDVHVEEVGVVDLSPETVDLGPLLLVLDGLVVVGLVPVVRLLRLDSPLLVVSHRQLGLSHRELDQHPLGEDSDDHGLDRSDPSHLGAAVDPLVRDVLLGDHGLDTRVESDADLLVSHPPDVAGDDESQMKRVRGLARKHRQDVPMRRDLEVVSAVTTRLRDLVLDDMESVALLDVSERSEVVGKVVEVELVELLLGRVVQHELDDRL